jgi:nucleoside-diphosphate-sugar epimerase
VAACSAGTQERDFLHSSDVASALLTLLESGLEGPVNIGSGCAVPVRRVIELVGQYCGRPDLIRLGLRPTPPNEPDLLVADVTRLREELGWRPRFELEHGLQDAVEWWKKLPAG